MAFPSCSRFASTVEWFPIEYRCSHCHFEQALLVRGRRSSSVAQYGLEPANNASVAHEESCAAWWRQSRGLAAAIQCSRCGGRDWGTLIGCTLKRNIPLLALIVIFAALAQLETHNPALLVGSALAALALPAISVAGLLHQTQPERVRTFDEERAASAEVSPTLNSRAAGT